MPALEGDHKRVPLIIIHKHIVLLVLLFNSPTLAENGNAFTTYDLQFANPPPRPP